MEKLEIKNINCHATLAMIEKRWGFPRRTLRALLGMTKNTQSGRSMIEMLGVLAIIGVLSVGGIAGYSKAMQKYRINKAIEQITLIAGNVRSFFAPQRSYNGLGYCVNDNDACKLIKKAKLMPDEMWDDTDKKFKNVFGYYVGLMVADRSKSGDKQAFRMSYTVPVDEEICIELLSQDWTDAGVKGIALPGPRSAFIRVPVSVDTAVSRCSTWAAGLGNSGGCNIYFLFDVNNQCNTENNANGSSC